LYQQSKQMKNIGKDIWSKFSKDINRKNTYKIKQKINNKIWNEVGNYVWFEINHNFILNTYNEVRNTIQNNISK
jgi:hypothetical protein